MKIKRIIKTIKISKSYLKNGKYSYDDNYTMICDKKNIVFTMNYSKYSMEDISFKDKIKRSVCNIIIPKEIIVKNSKPIFEGNYALVSSNDNSVKVFEEHRILTHYNNIDYYKKIISNKSIINEIFPTPQYLEKGKQYTIEEIITSYPVDNEKLLYDILEKYSSFFEKTNVFPSHIEIKLDKHKIFDIDAEISESYSAVQHGDIWVGNVLYDKKRYYYIDYENVGDRFFLYDFFFYMYSFVFMKGDSSLIKNYFLGKYDNALTKYFESLKLKYDSAKKEVYYKQFIVSFINERFKNYSARVTLKEFNKMIDIMR